MKKLIFLMFAFLLTIFLTSEISSAQNTYNQSAANKNVSQPGNYAIQSKSQSSAGSNNSKAASANPREGNLSSFMRDSASGDGLGKYLANNTSNPATANYQSYLSPSQAMIPMSSYNPAASTNTGSSMNTVTRSDTDLQTMSGSDDISRSLANITEQLNMLQQKLDTLSYNKNTASSNNTQRFMPGPKTNEITSTSEMYSGLDENPVSGYQKNNMQQNSYLQNPASSRSSRPMYQSNNVTGAMAQAPEYESLDQIKTRLDEMSRSIDFNQQTPRENPAQYRAANPSPRAEDQLTNFKSYSQLQFDKYFSSAQEQLRLGNFYQAADSFTLASIYEPDNAFCYAGHGHALFAAGQFVNSALYIIRSIELNPDYIQTNINLVTITGGRDITVSRIAELEQLLKKAPASGLQFLTAYVYYRTGQLAEARQIISAAYPEMPNSRAALTLKIAIETKLNN